MNQNSYQALTAMLTAFPQSQADLRVLLLTYEEDLTGISDQAICETAQKFRRNEIPEQSATFAPSIAEFVTAARRQEEFISIRSRPRLPRPALQPAPPLPPIQRRTEAELARAAEIMREFHASAEREKLAAIEAERAEIRARYGLTPERLASIPDQPLPEGMAQVGAFRKSA